MRYMEIFNKLDIVGFNNYSISNYGRVLNNKTGYFLKPCKNDKGYFVVSLSKNSKVKKFKVHKLVALLFCDGDKTKVVNHIDGIKTNNFYTNLEFITQIENLEHAYNIDLTNKKIKKVLCIEIGKIFDSAYEASKYFNIGQGSISNVCSGKRKSAGGYTWRWL